MAAVSTTARGAPRLPLHRLLMQPGSPTAPMTPWSLVTAATPPSCATRWSPMTNPSAAGIPEAAAMPTLIAQPPVSAATYVWRRHERQAIPQRERALCCLGTLRVAVNAPRARKTQMRRGALGGTRAMRCEMCAGVERRSLPRKMSGPQSTKPNQR